MSAFTIVMTVAFAMMALVGLTGTLLSINRKSELDFLRRRIATQDAVILALAHEQGKSQEEYQTLKKQANREVKRLKQRNAMLIATDEGRRAKNVKNDTKNA